MQTTIDRSTFASYSHVQSQSTTGFRGHSIGKQQVSVKSFTQQNCRSSSGSSMLPAHCQKPNGKNGADHHSGFRPSGHHDGNQHAAHCRNDKWDRCGSHKKDQSHCDATKNKNHCNSSKNNGCHSTVKKEHSDCHPKKDSGCGKTPVKDHKPTCGGKQDKWCNSIVQDNKAGIDLGCYKIDLNKGDSSLLLTNKQTGSTTRIWGDPHIDTNGTSGMFNGPLTFDLPDHTKITVGTQAQGSVTYANQVTITKGNKAYTVNGLSQIDSHALTVERSHNGRQLDRLTPDGYTLVANGSGTGWIDPQTGRAPTVSDFAKA